MKHQFKTNYWGKDKSTKVRFQNLDKVPSSISITSCFVFAVKENKLLMVRGKRGWSLPGGHLENGETPEECLRREAFEEACIQLDNFKIVGGWFVQKLFKTELNEKYPDEAYQLLYYTEDFKMNKFVSRFEVDECKLVRFSEVHSTHHDFKYFEEVYDFVRLNYSSF